jgi:DNA modification methylase
MDDVAVYNEDSRRLSGFVEADSVDFVVFSPPYWRLRDYGCAGQIGYKQPYGDYLDDMGRVFRECFKVLKPGRFMAVNVGTVVSNEGMKFIAGDFVSLCCGAGFTFRKDIVWCKPRGTTKWQRGATQFTRSPYPLMFNTNINHEFILIFQKGGNDAVDFSDVPAFSRQFVRKVAYSVWDIIPINSPSGDERHAAPFPEEIPRRLILLFTFKGEVVLDPFAGCGTTNKVAKELGRRSIAVELSPEYCELIKAKVSAVEFDSLEPDVYDDSRECEVAMAREKMDKAKREYDKAKLEYNKILRYDLHEANR